MYNSLKHWGILGMRWGVRKDEPDNGSSKYKAPPRDASKMSDDDLKRFNKRFNMEKNYEQLLEERSMLNRGQNIIKKTIAVAAVMSSAYAIMETPMGKSIMASFGYRKKKT